MFFLLFGRLCLDEIINCTPGPSISQIHKPRNPTTECLVLLIGEENALSPPHAFLPSLVLVVFAEYFAIFEFDLWLLFFVSGVFIFPLLLIAFVCARFFWGYLFNFGILIEIDFITLFISLIRVCEWKLCGGFYVFIFAPARVLLSNLYWVFISASGFAASAIWDFESNWAINGVWPPSVNM